MTVIYVDADACPVKAEAERVATRHGVPLVMVSDGGLRPSTNPLVRHVFVDPGPDAADRWIAAQCGPGDVVVTADIPLADQSVTAGALAVTPDGDLLESRNIGPRRAARDLMAGLRAADPFHQGRGRSFSRADRSRFLQTLERALQKTKEVRHGR